MACFLSRQYTRTSTLPPALNRPPSATMMPPRPNRRQRAPSLARLAGDLTWSEVPLHIQVLTQVALSCVATVVIRESGAAESVGEGVRAGVPTQLQRGNSSGLLRHSSRPTLPDRPHQGRAAAQSHTHPPLGLALSVSAGLGFSLCRTNRL